MNNGDTTQDEISPPLGGGGGGVRNSFSEKVTLEIRQSSKIWGRGKEERWWGNVFQVFLTRFFLSSKFLLDTSAKSCFVLEEQTALTDEEGSYHSVVPPVWALETVRQNPGDILG